VLGYAYALSGCSVWDPYVEELEALFEARDIRLLMAGDSIVSNLFGQFITKATNAQAHKLIARVEYSCSYVLVHARTLKPPPPALVRFCLDTPHQQQRQLNGSVVDGEVLDVSLCEIGRAKEVDYWQRFQFLRYTLLLPSFNYLLLSTGHHMHKLPDWRARFGDTITPNVVAYLDRYFPPPRIVILLMALPAHTGCSPTLTTVNTNISSVTENKYHWAAIDAAQRDWYAAVAASPYRSRYIVLDSRALLSRPDAHRDGDCLHWCVPGPVQTILKFVFHLIKRSTEPVY